MQRTPTIWIVHREADQRAALARMAGAGDNTLLGGPTDKLFESAAAADVVLLGMTSDFERELDFVHRVNPRLADCRWILLADAGDLPETERLFDTVSAELLPFPPRPRELMRAIAEALRRRKAEPLSRRRGRELLEERFARWFRGLDLPDLIRVLDPSLARMPVLVRGEAGTGRGLLARYAHGFGPTSANRQAHVTCEGTTRGEDVLAQIADAAGSEPIAVGSIWLEDVDLLPRDVQRKVLDWIEFGLPEGCARGEDIRWLASAGDDTRGAGTGGPELDPQLGDAFAGLTLGIPALRQRPHTIEPFVADTALAWCRTRGEQTRHFGEETIAELERYPWPGNLRELESVVVRTLALCSSDPVLPVHLRFEGAPAGPPQPMSSDAERAGALHPAAPRGREEPAHALAAAERPTTAEPDRAAAAAGSGAMTSPVGAASVSGVRAPDAGPDDVWRRIMSAVAHEVRNPLVSIRTFSELLAENFDDEQFRGRFAALVGADVRRIEDVVTRLQDLLEAPEGEREPVDVAAMLEELLDERREEIQARRLLVLKELDRSQPYALGKPEPLRRALAGAIGKALSLVPERGDVYLASKHHSSGLRGGPSVRILLRYHNANAPSREQPEPGPDRDTDDFALQNLSLRETVLENAVAEVIVRAQGGTLTVDNTDSQETLILIDLPAPQ